MRRRRQLRQQVLDEFPVVAGVPEDRELVEYLLAELTTPPHHELGLFALAAALWVADGRPGLDRKSVV